MVCRSVGTNASHAPTQARGPSAAGSGGLQPRMSAACSHFSCPLIARYNTSYTFIVRSTAVGSYHMPNPPRRLLYPLPLKRSVHMRSQADRSSINYTGRLELFDAIPFLPEQLNNALLAHQMAGTDNDKVAL